MALSKDFGFYKEHPDFNFLDEEKEIKLEGTSVDYFVGAALIHQFYNNILQKI